MHIPWSELGQVLVVGLLAGAGVVALFAAGVRLLSGAPHRPVPAYSCFALCGVAVLYGLYTLLPL